MIPISKFGTPPVASNEDDVSGTPSRELTECLDALAALIDSVPESVRANLRECLERMREVAAREHGDTARIASFTDFLQMHGEREKRALARELHDSLGGILTPAKMDLAWLEERLGDDPIYGSRVKRLSSTIDQGIDLKRRIIEALRPSLLDHLGLSSALQWYVDETCRSSNLACAITIDEKLGRYTPDEEISLYRLVQDALENTLKHAHAKRFELVVRRTDSGIAIEIADDGVGIAQLERVTALSHGIAGMMHRVHSLNGSFDIRSHPGEGTRIMVHVPLAEKG